MARPSERVIREIERVGVLRPRDLDRLGVPREHLSRLFERGLVERVGRGLYVLPGGSGGERQTIAEAARRVEHGVVCLLSALRFHELTTQEPFEVWMAIDNKARHPQVGAPPIRVIRMSGEALGAGIDVHNVGGVPVRVFNPAKTVADCFKFRNKIGLDVAVEALRDYRRTLPSGIDELWRFARICRVANVMRPYLEATA
jgi:predicted transcriptional regulator of viral defense system